MLSYSTVVLERHYKCTYLLTYLLTYWPHVVRIL